MTLCVEPTGYYPLMVEALHWIQSYPTEMGS